MGVEQDRALERANAAISVFEVEAKLAKIAYGVRSFAAIPAEAGETIGALARLFDLDDRAAAGSSNSSYDNDIPQEILFNSGGPMLMVPYIHKGPLDTHHVGIAWDGSRLAARALRDAIPFLMRRQGRDGDCRQRKRQAKRPRISSSAISRGAASRRVSSG